MSWYSAKSVVCIHTALLVLTLAKTQEDTEHGAGKHWWQLFHQRSRCCQWTGNILPRYLVLRRLSVLYSAECRAYLLVDTLSNGHLWLAI